MATDPVCGMEVDPENAAATGDYGEEKHYFCAPGCRQKFDAGLEKYPGGAGEPMSPQKKEGFWAKLFKG